MRVGWKLEAVCAFLFLQLYCHECFSLNLEGLVLRAFRSRMEIDPNDALQNRDTRDDNPCNWKGVHCVSGRVYILKLRGLNLVGSFAPEVGEFSNLNALLELQEKSSHEQEYKDENLQTDVVNVRRRLLQKNRNLPVAHLTDAALHTVAVAARGSGFFPAVRNSSGNRNRTVPSTENNPSSMPAQSGTFRKLDDNSANKSWEKWIYKVVVPATAFIVVVSMILFVISRRNAAVITPWKTGLSGQLQKAFITGVPKLNKAELDAACEYFSNIVITYPSCTVFKGTLSNGVEIAVVSTKASSLLDWSDRSEMQFRSKIDTFSRINQKNFINLLGYCQEEDPFMRMMVFEYAPNGTLFDHLHVPDFEHLQWSARMRIIMGIAYCLQYMHNLNSPVVHPILQSSSIFITEDCAAKIADIGIFSEPIGKGNLCKDDGRDNTVHFTCESNVYSFGILLLEIISGRMPISEEDGLPILNWAVDNLKDKKSVNSLVDPALKSIKEDELEVIYEAIKACILDDPKSRPTMKEVAALLRNVIAISPQEAAPRLSPLWWAELEILSVEAS